MSRAAHQLGDLWAGLRESVPILQSTIRGSQSRRVRLGSGEGRLWLGADKAFMHLRVSPWERCSTDPLAVLAENSALLGPARLLRRSPAAPVSLAASWPVEIPAGVQALELGADLNRIADTECGLEELPVQPIEPLLQRRLMDWTIGEDGFREIPSHGPSWEFVVATGRRRPRTLQVRVESRLPGSLSVATLITNCTADDEQTQRAVSAVLLVLNGRLRWVRLCLRDALIEAEVSLPLAATSSHLWGLARTALAQGTTLRETLKLIQVPAVSREFERIHGCHTE